MRGKVFYIAGAIQYIILKPSFRGDSGKAGFVTHGVLWLNLPNYDITVAGTKSCNSERAAVNSDAWTVFVSEQISMHISRVTCCCILVSSRFLRLRLCEQNQTEFYFCVCVHRSISQIKHQLDATLCRFYFCRVTLHVSGVKRPSSGVLKNWHGGPWYRCYSCR